MGIKITPITDNEDYLDYIDWLKDIPFTDMTYLDCLSRCLSGQYKGLVGTIDGVKVGIMIYYIYDVDKCYIVGMWCRKNLQKFIDTGLEIFKSNGIKSMRCTSIIDNFEKISHMEKVRTLYEREL